MRLIDADKLKEDFYNRKRTPDDMKYMRVPAEVVYRFIDNAPTVTPDKIQAIMSDYLVCRCEPQRPQGYVEGSTIAD